MEIIGLLVFGAVIGALARLVLPGRQNIPIWLTILVGVVGALVGYYLAAALGVDETDGIDWIRWAISIAVAAVLVALTSSLYAGRGRDRV
jgi:uncharacterized membrane protein YeaQ/YmgE (transglycosylase-associated protein family)